VAFYSGKHGIFRVNSKEAAGGDGVTQFGRALLALNIDIICANSPQAKGRIDKHGVFRVNSGGPSRAEPAPAKAGGMTQFGRSLHALNIDILCASTPQAKGRVERANKTLQDRLVKELRLQGIGTIAAGNQLLSGFLADYNARFGKEPHNPKNLHRPLSAGDDLTDVFAWRSATAGSTCPTPPLTSCVRFHRGRSSRISTLAPLLPSFASSSVKPRSSEARKRRAVRGRSTTCSKSAEASPLATLAGRHRTGSTALSVGSDSLRQSVPPSDQ
jgi:hypothetical protein